MIDAKIAALQQLRESVVAAISVGAFGQAGDVDLTPPPAAGGGSPLGAAQSRGSGPIELPTGVFRGKGLADAVRLYLSIAKRKQTLKEIKAALMEGGLATTSEYFDQTLSSTVYRMRKNGEVIQFKDGWDLAESYPESFRQRMAQSTEAPKRAKKKSAAKKKAVKATADEKKPAPKAKAAEAVGSEGPLLKAV
jgi:hypothetical protein